MKLIPLLLACVVTNLFFSRADGKVQLTVDVAGDTKTSLNISPGPDCPQPDKLTRSKRQAAVRPFSVEDVPASGSSSDYETFNPAIGPPPTNNDYGGVTSSSDASAQSNFNPTTPVPGSQNFGGSAPAGRQPSMNRQPGMGGSGGGGGFGGQFGGPGGRGGQFGGPNGPNRRNPRNQRVRCRGNNNSPACRNMRGNHGPRRPGHRQSQYDDYSNGHSGPGGQRGPRNQRQRNPQMSNTGMASGSTDYNY